MRTSNTYTHFCSVTPWLLGMIFLLGWQLAYTQPLPNGERLRVLAARHNNILIGGQTTWGGFATNNIKNNERRTIVNREYNAHTGGSLFTPKHLQPSQGTFEFDTSDWLVEAIINLPNDHKIHAAHLLGRDFYMPGWWTNITSSTQQKSIMEAHIDKVMSHYRGKVHIWDVVNEALDENGNWNTEGSMCLRRIGMEPITNATKTNEIPKFIRLAFQRAEDRDTASIKLLNDNQNAAIGEKKTQICYEIVRHLKNTGVPIDGVGFQLHLKVDNAGNLLNSKDDPFSISGFKENMQRYADLGVDIYITELDIRIPANTTAKLEEQRQAYYEVVKACLSQPNCRSILMWGLDDANAEYPEFFPTIFDQTRKAKPAYYGVQDALNTTGEKGDVYYIGSTLFSQQRLRAETGDTTVFLNSATDTDVRAQWRLLKTGDSDGSYYISNVYSEKRLKGSQYKPTDQIYLSSTTDTGVRAKWKLVATGTSNEYYIENVGEDDYHKRLKASGTKELIFGDKWATGNAVRWVLTLKCTNCREQVALKNPAETDVEESQLTYSTFPVPFSDQLTLQLPAASGESIAVHFIDITGKLIYQTNLRSVTDYVNIETTNLPQGVYTMQIEINQQIKRMRVIKN